MPASLLRRAVLGGGLGILAGAPRLGAQPADERAWPDRPVRLINSGAAGSGIDLVARVLAEGLAQRLGQPFLVENRPGGGSVLAVQAHVQARPGESLLLAATSVASTVPYTFDGRLPYEPARDLVPVAVPASEFLCYAASATLPVRTLQDFVDHAAARPGALNWYSVPGFMELDARMLFFQNGLELTYVAYPGSPAALLDLVAGRIQFAALPLTPILGAVREGKVRALAVTSGIRSPALPEVPTTKEAGFPEHLYDPYTALFGWRGMAAPVRDRLAAAVAEVVGQPATAERFGRAGIVARFGGPEMLAGVIEEQRGRVDLAIRTVGLRSGG